MRAARLLSAGSSEQLAALFKSPGGIAAELKALSAHVGSLSAIEQVQAPRFKQYQRLSVGRASDVYAGAWVNAESARLGPVQLHVAQTASGECALLALHVDHPR